MGNTVSDPDFNAYDSSDDDYVRHRRGRRSPRRSRSYYDDATHIDDYHSKSTYPSESSESTTQPSYGELGRQKPRSPRGRDPFGVGEKDSDAITAMTDMAHHGQPKRGRMNRGREPSSSSETSFEESNSIMTETRHDADTVMESSDEETWREQEARRRSPSRRRSVSPAKSHRRSSPRHSRSPRIREHTHWTDDNEEEIEVIDLHDFDEDDYEKYAEKIAAHYNRQNGVEVESSDQSSESDCERTMDLSVELNPKRGSRESHSEEKSRPPLPWAKDSMVSNQSMGNHLQQASMHSADRGQSPKSLERSFLRDFAAERGTSPHDMVLMNQSSKSRPKPFPGQGLRGFSNVSESSSSVEPGGMKDFDKTVEESRNQLPEEKMAQTIVNARIKQALAHGELPDGKVSPRMDIADAVAAATDNKNRSSDDDSSNDLANIDMKFVQQYESAFEVFMQQNLGLMAKNPQMVYNLRVAKLQRIFQVTEDAERSLERDIAKTKQEKKNIVEAYKKQLMEAARRKAALEIHLRQELGTINQATDDMLGRLQWKIIEKNDLRAKRHYYLLQKLASMTVRPNNVLLLLPDQPGMDAVRQAAMTPAGVHGYSDVRDNELRKLQVDNSFLKSEVNALEEKLSHEQTRAKKYAWVDSLLIRMDKKHLAKLKARYQKKVGIQF